jgi:hypothetical protein
MLGPDGFPFYDLADGTGLSFPFVLPVWIGDLSFLE